MTRVYAILNLTLCTSKRHNSVCKALYTYNFTKIFSLIRELKYLTMFTWLLLFKLLTAYHRQPHIKGYDVRLFYKNILPDPRTKIFDNVQALGISNAFLVNLSVSDFVVGLWNMPITVMSVAANKWPLGNALCNFSGRDRFFSGYTC